MQNVVQPAQTEAPLITKPAGISGAPGQGRTADLRFRKPLLYPLSYGGEGLKARWTLARDGAAGKVSVGDGLDGSDAIRWKRVEVTLCLFEGCCGA